MLHIDSKRLYYSLFSFFYVRIRRKGRLPHSKIKAGYHSIAYRLPTNERQLGAEIQAQVSKIV